MTRRKPGARRAVRATLGFGAVVLVGSIGVGSASGAPGVPEAPVQAYLEDFENGIGNGAGGAQGIHDSANSAPVYTSANGDTYFAATDWRNGNRCNGIVLSYNNSTVPSWAGPPNANRCGINAFGSYFGIRSIARAMGQYNGTGDNEHIVSSYSECNVTTGDVGGTCVTIGNGANNGIMFRTSQNLITTVPGRYYRLGVDVMHANCDSPNSNTVQANDPRYQLRIRTAANSYTNVGGEINACRPNADRTQLTVNRPNGGTMTAFGLRYQTEVIRYTGSSMGLSLHNNSGVTGGNDGGFDNVRIMDVTPSLDKSFSPTPIPPGATSTVTFTITNTTDLLAKSDWSFTDTLPAGVVVASPNGIGGTCAQASGTSGFTRTATPGSNTITVTGGDLTNGMTSCTITVNVTAANPGTYTNGPGNISTPLVPPDPAQLQVLASWITLTKTAGAIVDANGNGRVDAGDTITYSFSVTNNGNVNVTGFSVTDPLFGTVPCGSTTLNAGTTRTCSTRTYTITQADIEAGVRNNTATATGTVHGVSVTSTDSTSTPIPSDPRIALDKTAGPINDLDGNGPDAGDTIVYGFVVTNTGNRPLNPVTVTDPKVGTVTCTGGALAPGASRTCTPVTYTLTQADVNAGVVNNTATASGTPPTGPAVTATDSTSTSIPSAPGIGIVKSAGPINDLDGNGPDAGDTIVYGFVVTNTGNVTLTSVTVTDPKVGPVTCTGGALAPGASRTCTPRTYVLTQADVNAGVVDNTATASGTPPTGSAVTANSSTSTTIPSDPSVSIDKVAGPVVDANSSGRQDAGDTITYSFAVTNTGNVTLNPVTVADPRVNPVTCPVGPLAPGATVNCTPRTYTLTQADVNAGTVTNTATASGTPPTGPAVTGSDSTTTTITRIPSLAIDKVAGPIVDGDGNGPDVGDTITYSFAVTNTGNVTLNPVTVADPRVNPVTCPVGPLAPGATVNCTPRTYTLTQADVDSGAVNNTATASGTPPSGPAVTASDSTSTTITPAPAVVLTKTAGPIVDVDGNGPDAGDTIAYTFSVQNTGNVTLNPVTVTDPKVGAVTCPAGPLAPGATRNCTAAPYTLTQADVNAGVVNNTATASGTPPTGPAVSDTDGTSTPVPASPSLTLDKVAGNVFDANGNGRQDAGDTITYSFTIRNAGNVTLNPVTVSDPRVGPVTCPGGPLAPGATVNCTNVVYTLTQADIDSGAVNNTATASGAPPTGPAATATDTTSTTIPAQVALSLDKTAGPIVDANSSGRPDAGDTITYGFAVTNTGNVTLDPVTVSDPKVGPVTCPAGPLAPGATRDCTAVVYTITQADVNAGVVDNTATATGTPPTGLPATATDTTSTPVTRTPGLAFDKQAGPIVDANDSTRQDAGDTITYTFAVANTGNVTLDPVTVSDPKVGPVTCPAGPLAPGATVNCTAVVYTLSQTDVDAGAVNNTAIASGTPPTGPAVTATDTTSTPITPGPALSLDKTAGPIVDANTSGRPDAGDTITYGFAVTNTGNVTLDPVTVSDPKVGPVTCPAGPLAPGVTRNCTAVIYTISQADVNAGVVNNTATASGTPPTGPAVTTTDSTSTPVARTPGLTIDKQAGAIVDANSSGRPDAGDTITYTFAVTNTGNVTLDPVTVSDPKVGPVTCPAGPLAPGVTVNCTAVTYPVTQDDVDAGVVDNTATASGTSPTGTTVTATDSTTTPIARTPGLALDKVAGAIVDANGNGRVDAGDTITYTFAVQNTGNVSLDPVTVADAKVGPVTCPIGTLAPGTTVNCTAVTYTLTQADVDAGAVNNSATASGTPPTGPAVTSTDTTSTPIPPGPGISIDKVAGPIVDVDGNGPDVGDTITYTFAVTNTGTVTLDPVTVSDPKVGPVTCPAGPLAPGATRNCTAVVYTITQADVDAGAVENTATASGTPPTGPAVTGTDSTVTPVPPGPALTLDKQAGPIVDANTSGRVDAGDTITYSFTVENTGNVSLDPVTVSDPKVGPVTCPAGPLAPGVTVDCTSVVYTLTQADVDAGVVNNTATASGTPPTGLAVTAQDSTTTPVSRTASLTLTKTAGAIVDANSSGRPDAGDTITYSFSVQNTGNVTLDPVTVSDPKVGPVTCPAGPLAPGATVDCTAVTYTLTQPDVDASVVTNTAIASGRPPAGAPVTDDDSTSTPIARTPSLTLTKTAGAIVDANSSGRPDAGDTITYSFSVQNTGNVTLDPVTVSDPKVGPVTCPAGPLAPGATRNCTAVVYTITQADVNAGVVDNTATATGIPPIGTAVTSQDSTTTPVTRTPGLTLTKTAGAIVDVDGNGPDAGDTITYSFSVLNTGNVTLDPVTVSDPKVGAVTCPAGPLAPGATATCTDVTYTVTQADVDAGTVDNTATASGTPPSGPAVTGTDSTVTPIVPAADLTLTKTAGPIVDANTSGRVDAGDTITYSFSIENTGNVTLDPVTVSDPKVGPVTCPAGPLAPGATVDCTSVVYTVTQADVDAGVVDNTATASGAPPTGPAVTDTDGTSTPIAATAALVLDKQAGPIVDANTSGRPDAGDTITYSFSVENTGNVTLDPVTISDPKVGPVTCPAGPLAPGATVDCTAVIYTLTQADVNAGAVNNTATASGTPPTGPAVISTDATSTPIPAGPGIALDKQAGAIVDADGNGPDAGDTITYSFTIENTGNVTLDPISMSDPKVGPVTCPAGPLAPRAAVDCTSVVYTLTQADVDAGVVNNTATVSGTPPTGPAITSTDTTTTPVTRTPSLTLDKQAGPIVDANTNGRVDAGDTITYGFTIENTGNVTLDPVTVSDPKVGAVTCPAGPLAPDSTVSCTAAVYTLTQADVDAGMVSNTATASGTPPTGPAVTGTDSTTTPVTRTPSLSLDKQAGPIVDANTNGRVDAGDTITYTFTVTNTGTVTLDPVTVSDPKVGAVTCPIGGLAPGVTVNCTAVTYVITQADVDAGTVNNTATASGTPPTGPAVTSTDATSTPIPAGPGISLDKQAGPIVDANTNGRVDAGDTITYSFAVTNTGTVTLDPVTVSDPKVGAVTCPAGPLAPGATVNCDAVTYTLTQADVNAGVVNNTATVSGTPPTGPAITSTDTTTTPVTRTPGISLDKQAGAIDDANGSDSVNAGDTITYTFTVRNTGNVTLDPVTVSDPKVGTVTCPASPVAPNASLDCDAVTYTLTQADIDAGVVNNTAIATGTAPNGDQVMHDDSTTTPIASASAVALDKQAGPIVDANTNGRVDAGDTITYTFAVENTGTVTLDPVTVSDPKVGAVTCPAGPLAPGTTVDCTGVTYTLTQADVDAGAVNNTATASGTPPTGPAVTSTDTTSTPVPPAAAVALDKQAGPIVDANTNGRVDAGDTITYTFTVENTGTVTLDPVTVSDPKVGAVACPVGPLAPGTTVDCTGVTYTLTQADLDAGQVVNTATASGTPPTGPAVTGTDSTTTPVTSAPAVALDKQAGPIVDANTNGRVDAGDTIAYSFTVENTGTVTLDPVTVSDPKVGAVACPVGPLAPGATVDCTSVVYTLTQADLDAGAVNNTATASGTPPTGPAATSTDTTSTPVPPAAAVALDKQAGPIVDANTNGRVDAGDTITYTFTIENTGNVTLDPVTVSDPKVGAVTCPAGPLAPEQVIDCDPVVYTLTQADLDAGQVVNTATASGTPPTGPAVTGTDSTTTPVTRTPSLTLDKQAGPIVDANTNGRVDAGDTITYTFTIENTGTVTLDPVTVSDPKVGAVACPVGPLAPGATVDCTSVVYTLTQADLDAGAVNNTATASGTPPTGPAATSTDTTSTPVPPAAAVALDKQAGPIVDANTNGRVDAGDTITYTFAVQNTGTVSLDPVTVSDPKVGPVTCPAGPLAPGATANCGPVTYALTQDDLDAGQVVNTATASGTPPTGPAVTGTDSTTTPVTAVPAIALDKQAGPIVDANTNGRVDAGDTITYSFTVENTGDLTLDPVTVSDAMLGAVTCSAGPLAPGATVSCADVTYTLTQGDVDAGAVNNTATASGTPPTGPAITSTDTTSTPVPPAAAVALDKQAGAIVDANTSGRVDPGDTITYSFTIENTGTVTLDPVTVSDPKVGAVICPAGPLAPGTTVDCTPVVYTLTQADIDAAVVNNTATVTGTPPTGGPVSGGDSTTTTIPTTLDISLDKQAGPIVDANTSGRHDAGDTITYTFTIQNTGNVTLDPVTVSDPKVGAVACPAGPMGPGATRNCDPVVYSLTQADIDAGEVVNLAGVVGVAPSGVETVDIASTTTPVTRVPGMTFQKSSGAIVDANSSGSVDAGDTIAYSFAVENTGNVSLDPVTVSDPKVGPVTCPAGPLAPGATANCGPVTYTLTQADVDTGVVDNTATASATPPTGPALTGTDSTTTPVPAAPAVTLDKQAGPITDANGNGRVDAGDTITYTFTVENTGNVTLDPITVSDPKVGAVTCPAGPLAPDATVNCGPVTYTLTQADVNAGVVDNTATVSGTPPTGPAVSGTDSTTTPVTAAPAVTLDKQAGPITDANGNGRVDVGDTITYTFTIQNTGTVSLDPVTVSDPTVGPVTCPAGPLSPGVTVNCDPIIHVLTPGDLDAGAVNNTATASGTPPTGLAVTSTDSTSTTIPPSAGISLDKQAGAIVDANTNGRVDAGDTIAYTFTIENTGTVTLNPVSLSDPRIGPVTCSTGPLAAGATRVCGPVVYTLTQADMDAGEVVNLAGVAGVAPSGVEVVATDSTTTPITRAPAIALDKQAGPIVDANTNGRVDAGDTITYSFAVENTGTVTLNPVTVSDPKVGPVTCPAGPLAPGATVNCAAVTYTLIQGDVDAGVVDNTATVSGTPPAGPAVTGTDSTTTPVTRDPAIALDKQAGPVVDANGSGRPDAGDTITYSFVIENTGTVTLDPVTVSDAMLGAVVCPAGPLAPGATVNCTPVVYTLVPGDIDTGAVNNSATASGTPPAGPAVTSIDTTSTPIPSGPAVTLDKQAGPIVDSNTNGRVDAGDTIAYTFVIENTGNVTLDPVTISDPKVGAVSCPAGPLAAGQTVTCGPVVYTLTQADVDAGQVVNTATASGTPPTGLAVTGTDSTTTPITRTPAVTLDKQAGPIADANTNGRVDAGDTIAYTFAAQNTGNVSLDPVAVSDPKVGPVTCPAGPLAPGATVTCGPVVYTLTQADVDAGQVVNTATASGTPPTGPAVTAGDTVTTPIPAIASLTLDKRNQVIDPAGDGPGIGDIIRYTFVVENTGNVTLDPITVNDPMLGGAITCPAGPLAPGTTVTCGPVDHVITQPNMDAGVVTNTATASGTPPTGPAVTGTDSTTTPLTRTPGITLDKRAGAIVDANGSGRDDAGDTIAYSFTVTNSGNVTLNPIMIGDPMLGGMVSCPVTSLAPGAVVDCGPVVYTLTQANVDAGQVVNLAGAVGVSPTGVEAVDTATTTTPITQDPAIVLDKQAGPIVDANTNGRVDAGDTIAYSFAVRNAGNVPLNPVTVSDPKVGAVTCPAGPVAPGATVSCTPVIYTLTQADIDAGAVNNTATASGTPPAGAAVSTTDATSTPIPPTPGIALDKQAGPIVDANTNGRVDAGDTITYTFAVTNTGTVSLTTVTVSDPLAGAVTCPVGPVAPGATVDCTAVTYTLTQADVDAGQVVNTATVLGTPPTGPAITGTDSTTTPVPATPAIALDKQAGAIVDANGSGRVDAGDTIAYSFAVANTGTVTLDPVTVADPKVGAVTCPAGPLAPGATVDCTPVTYTLTQADVNAGVVNNTATASGTPPTGPAATGTDSTTTTVPTVASLTLDKQAGPIVDANGSGRVDAGDTIAYSFAVANTGTVTLDPVTVADPKVGAVTCPAGPLAPGATVDCTPVTYTLTQADLDAGVVNNTATVSGTPPTGPAATGTDSTTTPVPAAPSIDLEKQAGPIVDANTNGRVDAGDTIAYTFTIVNDGTVTLDPITVSDPMLGGTITCPAGPLAPGDDITCGPVVHTLTQADLDAGQVVNLAGAVGVSPTGVEAVDTDTVTTPVPQTPEITVDKRDQLIDPDGDGPGVDDVIRYTFVVTNSGTVTLDPVTVSDPMLGGAMTCPAGPLAPGASITCGPSDHVISQTDMENAVVQNTATASGTPPTGPAVTGTDSTTTSLTRNPQIAIEKSAGPIVDANGSGAVDAGDTIDYSFLVRNSGNVLLNNVTVTDPLVGPVTCPPGTLMPAVSITCGPVTYTLTPADLGAAQVTNTATVTGTPAIGTPVTDTSTITTPVHAGAMAFDKQAGPVVDANGDGRPSAGDTITYTFSVRNTGNVPLDPITVSDPLVGPVSCPAGPLAPSTTIDCGPVVYTLTAADVAATQVVNNASATGTPPGGSPIMVSDTTTTPVHAPALSLDKQAGAVVDANGSGGNDAGDTITYTFVVANTGNLPVAGITVTDPLIAAIACPATTLAPGASMVCTAPAYAITDADLAAGQVVNRADVSGTASNGAPVGGDDSVTVATPRAPAPPPAPAVDLVKTADAVVDRNRNGLDAGDTVTFRFRVTNTGNVTLQDIRVTDPKVSGVTCPATSLAPGAAMTCTSTPYRITVADLNRGRIENTATVRATPPGLNVVVKSGSVVVPLNGRPRLTVTKTANRKVVPAGGLITYTIRVRNTGRGAARNVLVCDLIAANVSVARSSGGRLRSGRLCFATIRTLGVGQSKTYRVVMRVDRATRTRTTVNRAVAQAANAATAVARRTVRVQPRQRAVVRVPVTG